MLVASIAFRLLLFAVFAVAGVAKLTDYGGSRKALLGFGVPNRLANPLAILLPITELVVAAMLIPVASAWVGAVAAFCLLLCFLIVIGINLARGRTPDCHCFGQLHSAPLGVPTLARNALLACAAGFLVWQGPTAYIPSLIMWVADITIVQRMTLIFATLGLALLAVQVALLLQILKQQGRILLRLDALEMRRPSDGIDAPAQQVMAGLPVGVPAPAFHLTDLHGQAITLGDLLSGQKPVLLLFTNPHCGPCQGLLPEVAHWQREHRAKLTLALITEGLAADNRAKAAELGLGEILLQRKREVAELYQAGGTPAAVLVRSDGMIASSVAQGAEAIRALVAQSVSQPALRAAPSFAVQNGSKENGHYPAKQPLVKRGDPAPLLNLQDLDGKMRTLAEFRGRENVLLFWNPRCGFCQQMLNDLRNWDANPPLGGPRLMVISTGLAEDGRAMGLRSPVLIDAGGQTATAFGASGTPMAILLDADLRITSEIVAGAQAVFALANAKPVKYSS